MSETWFDVIEPLAEHVDHTDIYFDAEELPADVEEKIEAFVPFTEDCRRCIQQLICTLSRYQTNAIFSACLSKIIPSIPLNIIMIAESMYKAFIEKREIDTALLQALGIASWVIPNDFNIISTLARFIQETIIHWTENTYINHFFDKSEQFLPENTFTALAIFSIIANHWITKENKPQRALLNVPNFIANLLLRANFYWRHLGNMVNTVKSESNIIANQYAFEVDTYLKTGKLNQVSSKIGITALSSNSTTIPEFFLKATVQNEIKPLSLITPISSDNLAEKIHTFSIAKLQKKSNIDSLQNCHTYKKEQYEWNMTYSHLNTKCDALMPLSASPATFKNIDTEYKVLPQTPKPLSSTANQYNVAAQLPLITATIAITTVNIPHTSSVLYAVKKHKRIAAFIMTGLTLLTTIAIKIPYYINLLFFPTKKNLHHLDKITISNINKTLNVDEEIKKIQKLHVVNLNIIPEKYYQNHRGKRAIEKEKNTNDIANLFQQNNFTGINKIIIGAIYDKAYHSPEVSLQTGERKKVMVIMKCIQYIDVFIRENPHLKKYSIYHHAKSIEKSLYQYLESIESRRLVIILSHLTASNNKDDAAQYGIANKEGLYTLLKENNITQESTISRKSLAFLTANLLLNSGSVKIKKKTASFISGINAKKLNIGMSESLVFNYIFNVLIKKHYEHFIKSILVQGEMLGFHLTHYLQESLTHEFNLCNIVMTHAEKEKTNHYITNNIVRHFIPMLNEKHVKYAINSTPWGLMHISMTLFKRLGVDYKDMDDTDLFNAGVLFFNLLNKNAIPAAWVDAFLLPAKIHSTIHSENNTFYRVNDADILEAYFMQLEKAIDRYQLLSEKLNQHISNLSTFKNRSDFLFHHIDWHIIYSTKELAYVEITGDLVQKENKDDDFFTPVDKPWPEEFSQANSRDKAYAIQNKKLKSSFKTVDKHYLLTTINELPKKEFDFINNATINEGIVTLFANYYPGVSKKTVTGLLPSPQRIKIPLEDGFYTFFAKNWDETRIYSFWKTRIGYVIARTEHELPIYQSHLFDSIGLYDNFSLRSIQQGKILKTSNDPIEIFIDAALEPHADLFYQQIHKIGYDETSSEKIMRFLVPFYDCVENIKEKKVPESIASCTLEVLGLTSTALKASVLLAKIPRFLIRGFIASGSRIAMMLRLVGTQKLLHQIENTLIKRGLLSANSITSKKAFISLGLAITRVFDPGIELTYQIIKLTKTNTLKLLELFKNIFKDKFRITKNIAHHYLPLSATGGYNIGLSHIMFCSVKKRGKRVPMDTVFSCIPRKKSVSLKNEVKRVRVDWNSITADRIHGSSTVEQDLRKLEVIYGKNKHELESISDYTSGGSDAINSFLRGGETQLRQDTSNIKQTIAQMLTEYDALEDYSNYSYRVMNTRSSAADGFSKGDIITDKGFVSSSAILTNANNWHANSWLKTRKKPGDTTLLIIYNPDIEKKIAGNNLLVDHILIKPNTKCEIQKVTNIITTEGENIRVIAVVPNKKNTVAKDIYTGDAIDE
ncbi:MAG: hypothetical protein ACRC53_04430 [Plesiomonas sp.]|uniref:hypothetical protein n=1 Tax=Plesiomonas sp. TaxID=2486279 RepID=UPI003F3E0ECE